MGVKSGKFWVGWADTHARNSTRLTDLDPSFLVNLQPFIDALLQAGATVEILSTRRSAHRAYLFHWCWKISQGKCHPSQAEPMAGVAIQWNHGNERRSRAGALEMVQGFGLALPPQSLLPPALDSEHIAGTAVDMDITWHGTILVKDKHDVAVELTFMHDANANARLHAVGESYGVKKLANDGPHWSMSGR